MRAPRPRLVATDLDGTLLRTDGTMSQRNRDALQRVRDQGIPVVGVTGRGPRLMELIRTDLGTSGIVVCAQGGYVVDLATGHVLYSAKLERAVVERVVEQVEEAAGPLWLAVEDAVDHRAPLRVEIGFTWPYPSDASLELPREEVLAGDVLKFFLRSERLDQDRLLAIARKVTCPEIAETTHSGLGFVEVSPPGVTKAAGLEIAADVYGVHAEDVLAFGDMPNDLPMFAWAGRAVAVASAHPDVLAAADAVTAGNDEDGVAVYLEDLFGW